MQTKTKIPIVKNHFSVNFDSIVQTESIGSCVAKFQEVGNNTLIVVDSDNKYTGIITQNHLISNKVDEEYSNVEHFISEIPKIQTKDSLLKVARIMIGTPISQVPIFEKNRLIGTVSDMSLIENLVLPQIGQKPVQAILSSEFPYVSLHDTVGKAAAIFESQEISDLPILEDQKPVGLLQLEDLQKYMIAPQNRQTLGERKGEKMETSEIKLSKIITSPPFLLEDAFTIQEVFDQFQTHQRRSAIITHNDLAVGFLEPKDFLIHIPELYLNDHPFTIEIDLNKAQVNPAEKSEILREYDHFEEKFKHLLPQGSLRVVITEIGGRTGKVKQYQIKLRFWSKIGIFNSHQVGFGVVENFKQAFNHIETQLSHALEKLQEN